MILPEAFASRMQARLGPEWPAFRESLENGAPSTSIRLNPSKPSEPAMALEPVPWHPQGFYLAERPAFVFDPSFHAGAYYVQEASSMLLYEAIRQWLPEKKAIRGLDLAAAPGGKTTLLQDVLPEGSLLLANEVIRGRYGVLHENAVRWGGHTHLCNHDPRDLGGLAGFFDLLLLDAPCSGEGMFRKEPDALRNWSPGQVEHCGSRQRRILADALLLLKPGALLIYSTCTYNAEENENHAAWLESEYGLLPLKLDLPEAWGTEERLAGYQLYPHRLRGEGFYIAGYRVPAAGAFALKVPAKFRRLQALGRAKQEEVSAWVRHPERFLFVETSGGRIRSIPLEQVDDCMILEQCIGRLHLGREIGQFKGKDFIPSHELALSTDLYGSAPSVELDREEALRFLKREALEHTDIPVGWHCVKHKGLGLGWMKGIGKRANNYLPTSWRIRRELDKK